SLVGCDHVAACLQSSPDAVMGRPFIAADQLDENVDAIAGGELDRVVEPGHTGKVDAAVPLAVARGDGGDRHRTTALTGEFCRLAGQDPRHAGANRAETGNSHTQ